MNDETASQLVKQLKRLNFWVTMFGTMFLISLAAIGFVLFQVITFVQRTGDKLQGVTGGLDVKQQVCQGTDAFSKWVKSITNACQ